MRLTLMILAAALPGLAWAAGGGGTTTAPPPTTPTTKTCKGVQVWDPSQQKCVNPRGGSLDQDTLYGAVRELAYAGRLRDAQAVLATMADQQDDRVLTYWGFTHRKLGDRELGNTYYQQAIARNPDNILARSYMGQGFVEEGRTAEAMAQWREIKARGGEGSWAERSLRDAIRTGSTYDY